MTRDLRLVVRLALYMTVAGDSCHAVYCGLPFGFRHNSEHLFLDVKC